MSVCAAQRVCFLSRFGLKTDKDFDHPLRAAGSNLSE